jgi:pimeloyl-ACP methyl ester carboxylesterase
VRLAISAIAAASARFGVLDAAIGHSFGGASLALAAAGFLPGIDPIDTNKLVLIGAPSAMGWLFKDFGRLMGLQYQTQKALETEAGRVTGRALSAYDERRGILDPSRPVLVIHAEDDKEVSADHARAYAAQGEHVRLVWANGFGHRRIVSAAPVFEAINGFLSETVETEKALESDDGTVLSIYRTPVRRSS